MANFTLTNEEENFSAGSVDDNTKFEQVRIVVDDRGTGLVGDFPDVLPINVDLATNFKIHTEDVPYTFVVWGGRGVIRRRETSSLPTKNGDSAVIHAQTDGERDLL